MPCGLLTTSGVGGTSLATSLGFRRTLWEGCEMGGGSLDLGTLNVC